MIMGWLKDNIVKNDTNSAGSSGQISDPSDMRLLRWNQQHRYSHSGTGHPSIYNYDRTIHT